MKRVIGIGGIFFKSESPTVLNEWYKTHLGLPIEPWGASLEWRRADAPEHLTYTAWSAFKQESTYFAPSEKPFMINYQVENLDELLATLQSEGVTIFAEREASEFGKFAWIIDPEGNKIELWQAPDRP